MATVVLDDALVGRFRAAVGPEEDVSAFTAEAFRALLEQRERQSPQWQAARAEAQAILNGPRHTLEESTARMRQKYNIPDLSHAGFPCFRCLVLQRRLGQVVELDRVFIDAVKARLGFYPIQVNDVWRA